MVFTHRCEVRTRGQGDVKDVTPELCAALGRSSCRNGVATVFVVGSTAGVTTIEFESGAVADLDRAFEAIAPRTAAYQHHLRWGDDNGSSHVRAAMLGPSASIPFLDARPALGTWQQVVLVEFDTRPREREVIVQVVGEP
jgi:secondary thiamine-phosphate synthase enzyme